ncbi:gp32 [Bacillus phage G]|uniref:Gp32 n=1 Tax=Bacillus phage G TaxID=2884420 RepID=G3MBA2_9CAUD|nr:gp32 [Bacillus phage G]AEO93303.1 gp32 [Bacillus phage G]
MKSNQLRIYDELKDLKKRFVKDKACPICGNTNLQTMWLFSDSISCPHGCIDIYLTSKIFTVDNMLESIKICVVRIFKESIAMNNDDSEIEQEAIEKVQKMIDYWKENDRYLVEILSK